MLIIMGIGLDMVVRDECGNILDTNSTSTTQLYEHHISAIERIRKATVSVGITRCTVPQTKCPVLIFSLIDRIRTIKIAYRKRRISIRTI